CVRRCFALIESSTLEQTREETETEKMTHLESLVELGLSSTFSTILTQCSMDISKVSHTHTHTHVQPCSSETYSAEGLIKTDEGEISLWSVGSCGISDSRDYLRRPQ